ncbi:MAG TPA: response regulator [Povalibacter sp.]|nr:response regulator [Povalibacter sp.]
MAEERGPTSSILIVEDEILVRMFAVDVLEEAGFRVAQAANGAEAFACLESTPTLAAAIVDLGLPDRPGDEVAAEIREKRAALPILIASGRSERELRERFANDERVAILAKPYTEPMLLEALRQLGINAA